MKLSKTSGGATLGKRGHLPHLKLALAHHCPTHFSVNKYASSSKCSPSAPLKKYNMPLVCPCTRYFLAQPLSNTFGKPALCDGVCLV